MTSKCLTRTPAHVVMLFIFIFYFFLKSQFFKFQLMWLSDFFSKLVIFSSKFYKITPSDLHDFVIWSGINNLCVSSLVLTIYIYSMICHYFSHLAPLKIWKQIFINFFLHYFTKILIFWIIEVTQSVDSE